MQRWEYKVVSLRDGRYTEALNEHGREGWELVSVAPDVHAVASRPAGRKLPMPRALGKLEDVASKLSAAEQPAGSSEPEPGSVTTTLLWIFRRPLGDE